MKHLLVVLTLVCALAAPPVTAASKAEIEALLAAMRNSDMLASMAEEGRANGLALQQDMLGGRGGAAWGARIERIYRMERIEAGFRATFDAELAGADITPLIDFFESPAGQKVIGAELAARRAVSDEAVEVAGAEAFAALDPEGRRHGLLTEFVRMNSLVEMNVAGAMTANLAFYRGMAAGGALEMDEGAMGAEVWGQEPEIRAGAESWVQAFMALAYAPLSDAELAEYVVLARSKPGRALNRALFAGFYDVFTDVSYDMGEAVARFLSVEEL
ncbi:MAG: DUF2059 domain-containing protein [Silicimonas sp.]|nr:DUF2059 domain-containing protein [Silicimonas sp.]